VGVVHLAAQVFEKRELTNVDDDRRDGGAATDVNRAYNEFWRPRKDHTGQANVADCRSSGWPRSFPDSLSPFEGHGWSRDRQGSARRTLPPVARVTAVFLSNWRNIP
jgi:hypothetical protein